MTRILLIVAIIFAPTFAAAQACGGPNEDGCPHGTIWSPLTQSCENLTMA